MPYVRPIEMDKTRPRATINTTIDKEVFESFKQSCKDKNLPMNIVLEQIMKQYSKGDFELIYKLKEDNKIEPESIKVVNSKG